VHNVAAQLTGIWRNELASELHLQADAAGALSGSFRSGVGERHDRCPLTGSCVTSPSGRQAVLGFVVSWPSTRSVTAWSGHFDVGRNLITATWLLAGESDGPGEWRSMHIGHDEFYPAT
jgi:hypothetical protein